MAESLEPDTTIADEAAPEAGSARAGESRGPGVARRVARAWSRFWFTPMESSVFTLWRLAIGVTSLAWLLSIVWDLNSFFGSEGLRPVTTYADNRIGLFQWFTSDRVLWATWWASVAMAVLVIAGRLVRIAAPLLFYGIMSIELDNLSVLNAGDDLIRLWPLYLSMFVLLTPAALVSLGPGGRDGTWPLAPRWILRLAQVQMTVIYPASVIAKLKGNTWWEGDASLYALGLVDFQRFPVPQFLRENQIIGAAMTWSTLLIEAALPLLLWNRRTRRVGIVLGVGLHLGFDYTMRLGFFAWGMTIGYIAFLRPSEAARILSWFSALGRFVPGRSGLREASVAPEAA